MSGRLIVIDGLDGSGKTTQLNHLSRILEAEQAPFRRISFPDYDNESSALVRLYLDGAFGDSPAAVNAYAASSFYAVDRYASYRQQWQADYEAGALILAARYTTSNAIHQMSKLPTEEWDSYLHWLEDYEYNKLMLPHPDGVILLDIPPETARLRRQTRAETDHAHREPDLHERALAYLETCRPAALYAANACGWHIIDVSTSQEHEVTAKLLEIIKEV